MLGSGGGIPGGSSGRDCTRRYATTTIFHRVQPLRKRAIGRLLVDGMRRLGPTFDVCSIPGRGAGVCRCVVWRAGLLGFTRGCGCLGSRGDAGVQGLLKPCRRRVGGARAPARRPVPSPSVPAVAPCPCLSPVRPSRRSGCCRTVCSGACSSALRRVLRPGPRLVPGLSSGVAGLPGRGRSGTVLGSGGPGGLAVLADRRSRQDPADLGSHHRAVRLTARWYDELVRLPWRRSVCGRCAAGIGRCAAGRGKRARRTCPMCDFPLPAHRETAPCGMLWITFVHIPGPSGTGDACGGIDGCDRSDPCRGGQAGPRRP